MSYEFGEQKLPSPTEVINTRIDYEKKKEHPSGLTPEMLKEAWAKAKPNAEVEEIREVGAKQVDGVMTLCDIHGKQISDELVAKMQQWVLEYRRDHERKRINMADPDNPGYTKEGKPLPGPLTQQQAMNAVCKHFNVKIQHKKEPGKKRTAKNSNYTPPKKKRRK